MASTMGSMSLNLVPPAPVPKTGVGTTTLITIAVQSGSARIVIALLQAGHRMQLRVVEMKPEIGWLGADFSEAAGLQAAQVEVINKLQSKQSPVEELLRQADQLITNQQPRAEVYAAMAESVGQIGDILTGFWRRGSYCWTGIIHSKYTTRYLDCD